MGERAGGLIRDAFSSSFSSQDSTTTSVRLETITANFQMLSQSRSKLSTRCRPGCSFRSSFPFFRIWFVLSSALLIYFSRPPDVYTSSPDIFFCDPISAAKPIRSSSQPQQGYVPTRRRGTFDFLHLVPRSSRSDLVFEQTSLYIQEMVKKKKKAAFEGARSEGDAEIGKDNITGRNLLSQMVRANMASDLPASMKMSDEEVASQIGTFILAGKSHSSRGLERFR